VLFSSWPYFADVCVLAVSLIAETKKCNSMNSICEMRKQQASHLQPIAASPEPWQVKCPLFIFKLHTQVPCSWSFWKQYSDWYGFVRTNFQRLSQVLRNWRQSALGVRNRKGAVARALRNSSLRLHNTVTLAGVFALRNILRVHNTGMKEFLLACADLKSHAHFEVQLQYSGRFLLKRAAFCFRFSKCSEKMWRGHK